MGQVGGNGFSRAKNERLVVHLRHTVVKGAIDFEPWPSISKNGITLEGLRAVGRRMATHGVAMVHLAVSGRG